MNALKNYLIVIAVVMVVGLILATIRDHFFPGLTSETVDEPEWCLIQEFPLTGGSFAGPGPTDGEEYFVLQTQSGFKVFQKCAKIK